MGNITKQMAIKKEKFIQDNGYSTFEEMLNRSIIVLSQYDECWMITPTERGFLAWVDPFFEQTLGYFKNYEEAEAFIDSLLRSLSVLALHVYGF